jgi:ubiquinone/menaquinone biosynthesis C-methylase UbiE
VLGIDLYATTEAPIDYQRFDGTNFPVSDGSFDAVLLCYVLHHAQDLRTILSELRRTLRESGLVVVYEDLPERGWDKFFCALHDRKWRGRTGACTFRPEGDWREIFRLAGFQILRTRQLSRWRNLSHPVSRRLYVLQRPALENNPGA